MRLEWLLLGILLLSGHEVLPFFKIFDNNQHIKTTGDVEERERTMCPHCSPHSIGHHEDKPDDRQNLKKGSCEAKYS